MARKSAFVNDMILQSLNQEQQTVSPVVKVVAKLDDEISKILENKNLDQHDKVKIYSQALQKYLSTRETLEEKRRPDNTEIVIVPETNNYSDTSIVDTVPKKFTKQANNLLRFIKSKEHIQWDKDGTVSYNGVPMKGTNIVDLFNDAIRNRKSFQPNGWRAFASALQDLNVPLELIGNPNRKGNISTPVVRSSKHKVSKRRKVISTKWTSF